MAEEQAATQEAEQTAEATEEKKEQAVTAEQLVELQKRLESITAAQAGSDRKVQELTRALAEERADKEAVKKSDSERLAELEQKWKAAQETATRERLKGVAREALTEAGVKANALLVERLVGADEEETAKIVQTYIKDVEENRAELAKKFDRENGRTVSGPKRDAPTSYEQLQELSDEQLANMNPKDIAKIIDDAVKAR